MSRRREAPQKMSWTNTSTVSKSDIKENVAKHKAQLANDAAQRKKEKYESLMRKAEARAAKGDDRLLKALTASHKNRTRTLVAGNTRKLSSIALKRQERKKSNQGKKPYSGSFSNLVNRTFGG